MSGRAIERKHHVGRRTIIKALASADPSPRKKIHREPTALGGLHDHIDAMIKADAQIAIATIWQRLADEHGATVAYPTLRTYVTRRRQQKKPGEINGDLEMEVTGMADFTTRTFRRPSAPVHGTLFAPVAAKSSAAVMLIGGSGGSEPSYVGQALAAEGVAALSVAYFARPGLPGHLRDIRLEYFFSALQILQDELSPSAAPIVVLGMSRGSEAAMLTAIHSPVRVHAVVATVPGNVVAGSLPPGGPAWLLDNQPLPYVDHSGPECENPDALIPAELVPGPVLLVAAGADQVWPSADMARALSQRMHEHGDPHGHTVLEYPKAGHSLGYLLPDLPTGLLPREITGTTADKAARADAWPKAVTFIQQLATPKS
jgi:dienelactone hydrolase